MRFRLKTHTFLSVFAFRTNTIENGGVCLRKRRFSKMLSRVEVFENGGSASLCGRAKTEVFENDYVTGQLKKQNGCFLIRFRWSSVDGRKRCKNASVDEKLYPFSRNRKRRLSKTHWCGQGLSRSFSRALHQLQASCSFSRARHQLLFSSRLAVLGTNYEFSL